IQRTRGTEYEAEVIEIVTQAAVLEQFALAPPLIREQMLNEVRARTETGATNLAQAAAETRMLRRLESANTRLNAAINDDPTGLAVRQGIIAPMPDFAAINTPDELADTLRGMREGAHAAEAVYGVDVPMLTNQTASLLG